MTQDPITIRFIEVFQWLKKEQRVRSARQFALSIDTYAQSFNDILKGRREATLQMVQRLTEVYNINAHYLLTGQGSFAQCEVNGVSTCPKVKVTYLQAHEFGAYASAVVQQNIQDHAWSTWEIPSSLVGQQIELAIQCNTDRLSSCIMKGDILFSRKVPRDAWKSSLSSQRIYAITLTDKILLVGISDNDSSGIMIKRDDRDLPAYIAYTDINEIWCPISKWSNNVISSKEYPDTNHKINELTKLMLEQRALLNGLQGSIQSLAKEETFQY